MSTAAILFLSRLPRFRLPLPLFNLTSSAYRLLSTAATTQAPPRNPHFAVVDYLIQSCGLPSDGAIRASKQIQHLKSPDKPDSVLRFLRHIGISKSDIRTAVFREPQLLCSNVENNLTPTVAKLQEIGLSIEDISGIISRSPNLFRINIVPKIDFWMGVLGSLENMSVLLKKGPSLLQCDLEKVLVPNLSFLQKECGLSVRQIVHLINYDSRFITSTPEAMKIKVKTAEELLGISCSSHMFVCALITVDSVNKNTLNSRVHHMKSLGLSQEEVTHMISKAPSVLEKSEELLGRKMEFLMNEAGCGKIDVVRNPAMLTYDMQKRLIPRSIVRKLLMSKGLPVANEAFVSFMQPSVKKFVEKFVLPYDHVIPGLSQAYADACAGKNGAIK